MNLAVSLFLAPLPALIALGYLSGGAAIPSWVLIGAVVFCAGLYWLGVLARRRGRTGALTRSAAAEDPAPQAEGAPGTALVLRDPQPAATGHTEADERQRTHDIRSFEDLPDPLAEKHGLKPAEVLIDRVSDITQIKRLVAANKVHLMTAWHRNVRDSVTGERDYGDWALEADRLLLSASFMTRTLTRHEAIAIVTAEVAARVEERRSAESASARPDRSAAASAELGAIGYGPGAYHHEAPAQQWAASRTPAQAAQAGRSRAEYDYADQYAGQAPTERFGPILDAVGAPAPAGPAAQPAPRDGSGVVRMLPQVVIRRARAMLDCAGWRTHRDDGAAAEGLDLFAEREGRIVGLRCVAGDEPLSPDLIATSAQAGSLFGTDLVAIIMSATPDRASRAMATHAGVVLLHDADLSHLEDFLPGDRVGPAGAGHTAAAE